jgi:hypothetical protein
MAEEKNDETKKPDLSHLAWALEQRLEIQRTLLELYRFVRSNPSLTLRSTPSGEYEFVKPMLLDHLIAAGFSLWRAVFLSESDREFVSITQEPRKISGKCSDQQRDHVLGR